MSDLARKTASIYIDQTVAQEALVKLQTQADKLTAAIKKGEDAGKSMTKEIAKLGAVKDQIAGVQKQIDQGLRPSFNQLATAANKANAELKKMSQDDPGYAKKVEQVKALKAELGNLGGQIKTVQEHSESFGSSFGKIFSRVTEYLSAYAVLEGLKEIFTSSIEEADQAELATVNLKNALDNIGRSDLFDSFTESAERLSKTFKALKDEDIKSVFTKLIDYGKLTKTQIDQLLPVIINYAAKQKLTLTDATDAITKSLEGNAKALKTYGINITDAKTVTERFGLIVNDLGAKVNGAEAAFESTNRGAVAIFKENLNQAKVKIGEFIYSLVSAKKPADELFDEAKEKTENYKNSLEPLLARYDELKSKTTLNKDEQTELQGIIQKIVAILPSAATELNKYGVALDINKQKVTDFLNENKKFLAEKEFQAVEEITSRTLVTLQQINKQREELNKGVITKNNAGGGLPFVAKATPEDSKEQLSVLRSLQEQLINDATTLTDKYGKKLPASVQQAVDAIKGEFKAIASVKTAPDKILGNGDPNADPEAAKKAEEARKKAEEERKASLARADAFRKQALDEIAKANNQEIQLLKDKYKSEADDQKKSLAERFAAITSYNDAGLKLIATTTAGQQAALDNEIATDKKNAKSKEELAAIEQLRVAKQADIDKQNALSLSNFKIEVAQKYTDVAAQEFKKQTDLIDKDYQHRKEVADQLAKDQLNNISINTDNQLLALDKQFQDGKIKNLEDYQRQYDAIVQAGHQKELEQQLKQLETLQSLLHFYGVKNSDVDKKVADLKVDLNKNANDKIAKDDEKALAKKAAITNAIMDGVQQVAGIIASLNDAKNAQDEAQIAENQKRLDDNTKKLDRELAKNLISQKEYDRQLKALQDKKAKEDAALKKKEFERNKQAQIIQAIMSGAQAIVSTLAARPGVLDATTFGIIRGVEIALAVATTAAQVATISSQKAPSYGRGGLLNGPSHSAGGMPVINPHTGRKVAEVEGGEPILSKKTYANNRELVDQLLRSSMYGNGARITPYWQQRSDYKPIDYSGINRSIGRVNYFANGGIVPAAESGSVGNNNQPDLSFLPAFIDAINNLNANTIALHQKLSEPIKTFTLLSDANATQDLYDRIKRETTITR